MRRLLILVVSALVAGCAAMAKVEQGQQVVADRLVVDLDGPWNRFTRGVEVPTWTVEGFTVDRLQFFVGIKPVTFVGEPGFKYSYTLIRRGDDVRLSGVGYGAVHDGELIVINYSAPRLGFFPRYQAQIEKMALGARLRS